jgi:hypothetical protein
MIMNNSDWYASKARKYWLTFVLAGVLDVARLLQEEKFNYAQLPKIAKWLNLEKAEIERVQGIADTGIAFQEALDHANKLFDEKDYVNAQIAYTFAQSLHPADEYVTAQIDYLKELLTPDPPADPPADPPIQQREVKEGETLQEGELPQPATVREQEAVNDAVKRLTKKPGK